MVNMDKILDYAIENELANLDKCEFLKEGENCSAEHKNSEYEYDIFEITRSVSNDYLSSINIDITYGGDQKIN